MKIRNLKSKSILLGGLLVLMTIFTACNDNNDDVIQPDYDVAGFMAINLVPDQAAVGVLLSGNGVGVAMPYMSYTGGYVRIFPGERSTDAFAVNSNNTITSTLYTYEPDNFYSLFVIGTEGSYENVIVNDGLDTLNAEEGKAYFRFINGITGNDAVSLKVMSEDSSELLSKTADYGVVSPFMALDSGAVTISISDNDKMSTERTVELEGKNAYTFLISGNPNSEDVEDSIQIRYIVNGTLTVDSTSSDLSDTTN